MTDARHNKRRRTIAIWSTAVLAIGVIFVACGGTDAKPESATTTTTKSNEDLVMTEAGFVNLHKMTPVDDHFIANPLGHLKQALKVANSPKGGAYPVGTVIQLVPQEAMVKRKAGFNAATNDWEFFFLDTSAQGTKIVTRGGEEVVNRFGGNCASCHCRGRDQVRLRLREDPRLRPPTDRRRRDQGDTAGRSSAELTTRCGRRRARPPCLARYIARSAARCRSSRVQPSPG